jgi:N-acetylmuramoyl-L-alanine amidase
VRHETTLALEVRVPDGGATDAWLRHYVSDPAAFRRKRGRPLPAAGEVLRLPLASLSDDFRPRVLCALFPSNTTLGADWIHRVGSGPLAASQETVDRISVWYTGSARNARALETRNAVAPGGPRAGQEIVIPGDLLLPGFRRLTDAGAATATPSSSSPSPEKVEVAANAPTPPELKPLPDQPAASAATGGTGTPAVMAPGVATPDAANPPTPSGGAESTGGVPQGSAPAQPPQEDDFTEAPAAAGEEEEGPAIALPPPATPPPAAEGAGDLRYGQDSDGGYAIYRLKRGEALYSAVVIRFTGRVDVQEVNDIAGRVARRSGITNVSGIPVGFPVKIPLDDLLPEYLPRDDTRRQAWERSHAAVERYTNISPTRNLDGVAVILDAGHGGRDIGAAHNGVWEHDYVYDILCRVKTLLETTTRARVLPTIKDTREGYAIRDATRLKRSGAEVLLTNPPFSLTGKVPSVNLRWYLSNAWYRRLVGEGFDPAKVVFTSLHADARHPSLRGAMVYVPGAEYRRGRYGSAGATYARYKEARDEPFVSFTRQERERSEGLSRQFAASLIDALGKGGVAVHPYGPVRERIIRRGRSWVPAVLRCNVVPVQVLIEVSNLSNPEDSRSIADPAYRQKVAEAYVEGLRGYFSAPTPGRKTVAAGAGRSSR